MVRHSALMSCTICLQLSLRLNSFCTFKRTFVDRISRTANIFSVLCQMVHSGTSFSLFTEPFLSTLHELSHVMFLLAFLFLTTMHILKILAQLWKRIINSTSRPLWGYSNVIPQINATEFTPKKFCFLSHTGAWSATPCQCYRQCNMLELETQVCQHLGSHEDKAKQCYITGKKSVRVKGFYLTFTATPIHVFSFRHFLSSH